MDQFQAMATGWAPAVDVGLLTDLLAQELGDAAGELAEEIDGASVSALKHRLHALRCDYAEASRRATEAEEQLAEARLRILRLEARVQHLDTTLQQIHASRWWKLKEWCAPCWRAIARRRAG